MWIVEQALRRPHTFIVMALAIALFGVVSITQMAVDIFPNINVPIVSCVWTYTGMAPTDVENLITTISERSFTSTVNGIEHMESMSLNGMSIIKIYLYQGSNVAQAVGMVTSVGNALLKQLPPNMTPPTVTASSATDVPVLQLGIGSKTLNEADLFDIANNFVRNQLATIQGATIPFPYGGKYKEVIVDLDPKALVATGLSAYDVVKAINAQNVIAPSGTAKMGPYEYIISLNNMPKVIDLLNGIPIKSVNKTGAVVYVRDVAFVHDGYQPQLNIVNQDGRRAVIFNILKNGSASTLAVVNRIKAALPHIQAIVPPACKLTILTDQSTFVSECVFEVVREAVTAAGLTGLMMLALLGSWRSTLIVITSIPLAIMCSIIGLHITGQTINSMTLGGLALAIGMLVDDATVEVENVHRNMDMGKHIVKAILDGADQVALPALVSTLAICIVFIPVVFLTEPARSLFVPLGMAVVFAMLASYGLSRTIVPLMSKALLASEETVDRPKEQEITKKENVFTAIHKTIEEHFDSFRDYYHNILQLALAHRKITLGIFIGFYAASLCLLPFIGQDFFPTIDAGQLRLHVLAKPGTRVEQTEFLFNKIENVIRKIVPSDEIEIITDNIGMPVNGVNYAFSDSQTISEADGEILITLSEHRKHSTAYYQKQVRKLLTYEFPECTFYFQPADIVTQILNAGLPSPIDIRITGFEKGENYRIAQEIKRKVQKIPGAVDVCVHQIVDAPQINVEVDRTRANQLGITQKDISNSVLVSLSSSFQVSPNFWLNRDNGVNYNLASQTPQYRISSVDDLIVTSITPSEPKSAIQVLQPQLLANLASLHRGITPQVVNHYNVQPAYNVYASYQERDLGGVSQDIVKILKEYKGEKLPRGTFINMGGQVNSMNSAFAGLLGGLVFALLLVYLLLVVNFQSWSDPIIILMAVPGAFSGILWSLFVTQTTFSIPALMGTIMTIGVASANSILMVNFAKEQLHEGKDALTAALNAGFQRFRPVIMTATAMIIGMLPMAIGTGQGGSQNAPIGRAVIGGLTVATFSTLIFVPMIFSIFRERFKQAPETELEIK